MSLFLENRGEPQLFPGSLSSASCKLAIKEDGNTGRAKKRSLRLVSRAGHIKARTPSSESLHENEPGAVSPPNKLVSDLTFLKKIFSCEIIISCNGNSVVG